MHAYLVVGGSPQKRRAAAQRLLATLGISDRPGGQLWLAGAEPITIDQVRRLQSEVAHRWPGRRAVVILEAQRLTLPAQHAVLKTLEEPGEEVVFALTADSERSLVGTIGSRCLLRRLARGTAGGEADRLARSLLLASGGAPGRIQRLYQVFNRYTGASASPHRGSVKRAEAAEFVEVLTAGLRQLGLSVDGAPQPLGRALLAVARAHRRLGVNLNPQLVLERFVLDL